MADSESVAEDINRLVDRELSPAGVRRLLTECERKPQLWRDIALAFIESQAFSQALTADEAKQTREPPTFVEKRVVSGRGRDRAFAIVLGVALGWLGAFGVGWLVAGFSSPRSSPVLIVEEQSPQAPSVSPLIDPRISRTETRDALASFPIYEAPGAEWTRANDESRAAFEAWRREVERAGAEVQVRHTLVGLRREDGAQAVAPVDQVLVRPVSRVTY